MWRLFGITLASLIVLDIPWVWLNMRFGVYKNRVNGIVSHPVLVLAIWLTILLSEAFLVSYIVSTARNWWTALLSGMFVGLVIYITFNGTALVCFRQWGWLPAIVDTAWGMILLGTAAVASFTLTFGWSKEKE